MRGRWALAAGVVVALVVVGGGAYASTVMHTKTVTKLCVYVDRTHGGDSYGDISVLPKYNHQVCIAGKRGPKGDSSVITWNTTIASPAVIGSPRPGTLAGGVDLAKVGPFTVRGYCESGEGVEAFTELVSAQDGSSLAWDDSTYPASFNSGDIRPVSNIAFGTTQSPGFVTEYQNGEFSASSPDQTTALTGWATNGVYIQGAEGPACSFIGHLVVENGAY